jgi:hypothetical protein
MQPWCHRRDQLLQTDRINILESKFGPTIETADIQIAMDQPHFLLTLLKIYGPILHDGIKFATATSLQDVHPINTYFHITHPASTKRPPKGPCYYRKYHTRFDSHDRVQRKKQPITRRAV